MNGVGCEEFWFGRPHKTACVSDIHGLIFNRFCRLTLPAIKSRMKTTGAFAAQRTVANKARKSRCKLRRRQIRYKQCAIN